MRGPAGEGRFGGEGNLRTVAESVARQPRKLAMNAASTGNSRSRFFLSHRTSPSTVTLKSPRWPGDIVTVTAGNAFSSAAARLAAMGS